MLSSPPRVGVGLGIVTTVAILFATRSAHASHTQHQPRQLGRGQTTGRRRSLHQKLCGPMCAGLVSSAPLSASTQIRPHPGAPSPSHAEAKDSLSIALALTPLSVPLPLRNECDEAMHSLTADWIGQECSCSAKGVRNPGIASSYTHLRAALARCASVLPPSPSLLSTCQRPLRFPIKTPTVKGGGGGGRCSRRQRDASR